MFRSEVEPNGRLDGETFIAMPISWQAISYLLLASLLVALIFLSLASYSRVETDLGTVTPDKGISTILPTRAGTVVELAVTEGQRVEAGDLLAQIRTEEDSGQGLSSAQQSQLAAQQTGYRSEIAQIQSQITIQKNLIKTAQADLERAQQVAERGFISQRDLQIREETLLARQQGLSELNQSLAAKQATWTPRRTGFLGQYRGEFYSRLSGQAS